MITQYPDEQTYRDAVVAEARSWLGTPYHHQANIKGVGVDCGMILIEIYGTLGVMEKFDPRPYAPDWHLHNDGEMYLSKMLPYVKEVPREEAKPGDIVLCRFGRSFSHSAIMLGGDVVLHAHVVDRCVTLADITKTPFHKRPLKFFSTWEN